MTEILLGCPGWGTKSWVGRLFPTGTRSTEFLERYARVFNTVEGNTTFYALPPADVVARWREQVPDTFRFCFKFPRAISHDKLLVDCGAELDEFYETIRPLAISTLMLQLPPRFDRTQLARLAQFLDRLPREHHVAVEPRHEEFFDGSAADRELQQLLTEREVDLVIMDARGLHRTKSLTLAEVRGKKPALPVVVRTTANRPIVRCVPNEDFEDSRAEITQWADQVAAWIAAGKQPIFFMHSPDDTFAPEHAYKFAKLLRARCPAVGELPPWPGGPRQLSLI
ncbi:MAG TPA: DUF72 domain-containing protein [Kofleriaceae bacterium]